MLSQQGFATETEMLGGDAPGQHPGPTTMEDPAAIADELRRLTAENIRLDKLRDHLDAESKRVEEEQMDVEGRCHEARRKLIRAILELDPSPMPQSIEWSMATAPAWRARIGGRLYGLVPMIDHGPASKAKVEQFVILIVLDEGGGA